MADIKKININGTEYDLYVPMHVGTTAPTDTSKIWFDTTSGSECIKVYSGSEWIIFGAAWK